MCGSIYPLSRPGELVQKSHGFDQVFAGRAGVGTKAIGVNPAEMYYGVVIRTKRALRRR